MSYQIDCEGIDFAREHAKLVVSEFLANQKTELMQLAENLFPEFKEEDEDDDRIGMVESALDELMVDINKGFVNGIDGYDRISFGEH
ncbi:MAG: hypothetical protein GY865_11740 [candidate division Zixibacteria bacterium]|nr:hypothetical protein [candidate division Zixibacteria bacterium]